MADVLQNIPDFAPEVISALAIKHQHSSHICCRVMNLWLNCLGTEANSLVLKTLSLGGVYLGGGIVPQVFPLLKGKSFLDGFYSAGNMNALLRKVPVWVLLNPLTALYGAARRPL